MLDEKKILKTTIGICPTYMSMFAGTLVYCLNVLPGSIENEFRTPGNNIYPNVRVIVVPLPSTPDFIISITDEIFIFSVRDFILLFISLVKY